MSKTRVLVTGMSGLIGGAVRAQLEGKYMLSALNRREVPGIPTHRSTIEDLRAIQPAFTDIDVVVHLAGSPDGEWHNLLPTNIIGCYNVFEASRIAGVKRIIYASSGATTSGWQRDEPYRSILNGDFDNVPTPDTVPTLSHETLTRSWSLYGCSKIWGEAIARHFTEETDLSILCLRIGMVNAKDKPESADVAPVWCSQRDAAQMVERCIETPSDLKFDIFYVLSRNKWAFRDISHAHLVTGYEPQDSAEDHWPTRIDDLVD